MPVAPAARAVVLLLFATAVLGRASKDNVRRHDVRTILKDAGTVGSFVDMYSR